MKTQTLNSAQLYRLQQEDPEFRAKPVAGNPHQFQVDRAGTVKANLASAAGDLLLNNGLQLSRSLFESRKTSTLGNLVLLGMPGAFVADIASAFIEPVIDLKDIYNALTVSEK